MVGVEAKIDAMAANAIASSVIATATHVYVHQVQISMLATVSFGSEFQRRVGS